MCLDEATYPIATQVGAKGTFGTLLSGYMITLQRESCSDIAE